MKKDIHDELTWISTEIQKELNRHRDTPSEQKNESILVIDSDAPTKLDESAVLQLSEQHFRCKLGRGFGLDIVLLSRSSLAFTSFGGSFLNLRSGKGWPGSLFNPIVGEA